MVEAGGQPNQARGEGLLAVFGLKSDPVEARRAASSAISAKVDVLNDALADRPVAPVRFGIGVNAGNVIAGEIGCDRHAQFTAIGDAVNLASRLQDLTRTFDCEALMSEDVHREAGPPPDAPPAHEVDPRGRDGKVKAQAAKRAADLRTAPRGFATPTRKICLSRHSPALQRPPPPARTHSYPLTPPRELPGVRESHRS